MLEAARLSLLLSDLVAVHIATLALTYVAVHVVFAGCVRAWESGALAAVPRASHHVFAQRAALLDGSFEILVGLLLDGLCIL